MTLYKYRDNSPNTDKIFTEKKVWLSNAAGLNDPFECSIQEFSKDWIEKNIKSVKEQHLSRLVNDFIQAKENNSLFWGLPIAEAEEFICTFKNLANFDEKYDLYREFKKRKKGHYPLELDEVVARFDQQLNNAGIFSLSETSENQLMWSHYAGDTKGIAIGFEVEPNSKLANSYYCVKVNYSDSLPAFIDGRFHHEMNFNEYENPYLRQKISFTDPTFRSAISTKPTVWSYEREWRYIEEQHGAFPLPSKISEIVFGLRCSKENKEKYKEFVKSNFTDTISFFEIQAIPNTNKIIKVIV